MAIGAFLNDGGGTNAGSVRVYTNSGGGWEKRGSDLDGSAADDNFGWSVAISGDGSIVAVGARLANSLSGQVHVYRWIFGTWQPMGSTIDGVGARDRFGYSVALSYDGTILAAGARLFSAGGGINIGHARVFAWTGTDWNQRGSDLAGSSNDDQFGDSVALSSNGSIVAAGGDQGENGGRGYARIYRWSGSAWEQLGSTIIGFSFGDQFGETVSLSADGTIVAVAADRDSYVAVYRYDGTDWFQIGQTIRGEARNDQFGFSMSLSSDGNTVVIGGYRNDSDTGHALIFTLSPNGQEWIQVGQELVGEAVGDQFGIGVSIADNGNRIAIGATRNDGSAPNAGSVQVYDFQ